MNKAIETLDVLVKHKSSENDDADADASVEDLARLCDKERIDNISEKKAVGRPAGTYEKKKKHYLAMLNEGKIKMPKAQTLEFYKIERDGEVYTLVDG